jgi:prevent-host-death family protein
MAAHPKPLPASRIKAPKPTVVRTARSTAREPIAAAKAKTHFLQLLDEVVRDREPITITKRGKIVAQLIPASEPQALSNFDQVFGRMAGTIKITGDIVSPDWESWGPEWR